MAPPSVPSPTAQLVGTPDSSCFADIDLLHPADSTSLSLLTALPFSPSPGPWSPLPRLLQLPLRSLAARSLDDHSVCQSAANVLCLQYRSDRATVLPKPSPGFPQLQDKVETPPTHDMVGDVTPTLPPLVLTHPQTLCSVPCLEFTNCHGPLLLHALTMRGDTLPLPLPSCFSSLSKDFHPSDLVKSPQPPEQP